MQSRGNYEKVILSILFFAVYFVSLLQPIYRVYIVFTAGVLIILYPFIIKRTNIRIDTIMWCWIATLLVISISMIRVGGDQFYLLFYGVFILCLLFLRDDQISWAHWGISLIYYMGIFYSIFTIIQVLFKDLYISQIAPIMVYNSTFDPVRFMRFGIYSGLTYQVAVNAMYLAMGIGAAFIKYTFSTSKKWNYLLVMGVEFVCIMLTSKRAHLLFGGLALMIVAYINSSRGKRFTNIIRVVSIIFLILFGAYNFLPSVNYFFNRLLNPMDDISNGRINRYIPAWRYFQLHPLFGIGWEKFRFSYVKYSDVHNIYLQLLCETGLIGTVVFILAFALSLKKTIEKINISKNTNLMDERAYLSFSLFAQVFFLLYGLTGNGLYDYYVLFFYIFGVLINSKCNMNNRLVETI